MIITDDNFVDKNKYGRGEEVALYYSDSNSNWKYTITYKASTEMYFLYKVDKEGRASKISSSDNPMDFEKTMKGK